MSNNFHSFSKISSTYGRYLLTDGFAFRFDVFWIFWETMKIVGHITGRHQNSGRIRFLGEKYGIRESDSDREIGEIRLSSFNREQQDWGQNWEFQLFT